MLLYVPYIQQLYVVASACCSFRSMHPLHLTYLLPKVWIPRFAPASTTTNTATMEVLSHESLLTFAYIFLRDKPRSGIVTSYSLHVI